MKAWNNLGLLNENQGSYSVYTIPIYHAHYSKINVSLGNYNEAERVLREGIKQMPYDSLLYYSLGVLLGRTNRLQVIVYNIISFMFKN